MRLVEHLDNKRTVLGNKYQFLAQMVIKSAKGIVCSSGLQRLPNQHHRRKPPC